MQKNQVETPYASLYFFMPAIQFILDKDGYIVDINEFAALTLGYKRNELIGAPVSAVVCEEDHHRVKQQLQFMLTHPTDVVHAMELRQVTKSGKILFVKMRIRRKQIDGGETLFLASCYNISSETYAKQLLAAQKSILELIAKHTPLEEILTRLVYAVEEIRPKMACSILLVDEESGRLYHKAAPSLPKKYIDAVDGLEISPHSGSCGAAAYRQEIVIVNDIQHNPLWEQYKHFALPHGLRSCWSVPIFSSTGKVLGTFAIYYYEQCEPHEEDIEIIYTFSSLAGLALEREKMKDALQESRQMYESLFHFNQDAVFSLRLDGKFFAANEAAANISGYSRDELLTMTMYDFIIEEDLPKAMEAFRDTIKGHSRHLELRFRHQSGNQRYASVTSIPILVNEKIIGVSCIAKDVTERIEQEERIRYMAYHDSLTGLPNRRLFHVLAAEALMKARQSGNSAAILYLDLDGFKYINDSIGHLNGDKVLKKVAELLKEKVGSHGTVGHMSGDEFTILLPSLSERKEAVEIAKELLSIFKEPLCIDKFELFLTCSIGIAFYPYEEADVDTIISYADIAMYEVKRKGKNGYYIYDADLLQQRLPNIFLLNDLHHAIKHKTEELHAVYQPIVDIRRKQITAMETLIRWHHPVHGTIFPGQFISLAEETGLIVPIGEWIIRQACRQHERWRKQGLPPIRIAVNVSVKQLQDQQFASRIEAILTETKMEPKWLELEITENMFIYNETTISNNLRHVKELGVRISIDDFGTGYSSLAYLKHLDFDTVKIDRSFISDCPHSYYESMITNTIISLAHHLGINVVAEGVERPEQIDYLREKGCQEAQGYFFHPPLPANEATLLLQKGIAHLY
ncbi:bifunctional diguanylate cyclase/phosphodiesterase [Saccharococcus thermophilus]|uniref:Diguanylate cyclase (GGDEF)-like protein/PAS domain S-box-containing protein n=1 Tax=Saccharococcus thermophilus TaxID=29396 RepID=A0A846MD50_9BACL|nr:EAL domain-containing protein [Saccharococcus thermophilus]NIK14407.1 diguanylate cyclase (GGDEF)-like protein/PAS domain S-box-containing protein [Saccharococcus thermophilus]